MSFQRVPNTVLIEVVFTLEVYTVVNTYHADRGLAYTQSELDDLASRIDSYVGVNMMVDLSVDLRYERTDVRGLDQLNDLMATADLSSGPGGDPNRSMPANVAFVVQKLSALTGRSARGRVYVAGMPVIATETGAGNSSLLQAVFADAYTAHVDAIRGIIDAQTLFTPVIVSRYTGGSKRSEGVTFEWIVSQHADRKLDTRRTRLRS